MGRKQTYVSGFAGGPLDGAGWARPYKIEWGEVVGQRVRRLREAHGWTLLELATRVPKPEGGSYSGGYFSRLERGWASPPLYVYVALAEVFGVRAGELLGIEDLERELAPRQRMLLDVVDRLGLEPDEAVVRLLDGSEAAGRAGASNVL